MPAKRLETSQPINPRDAVADALQSAGLRLRLSNKPNAQKRAEMLLRQRDSYAHCGDVTEWWVCTSNPNHKAKPCPHRCKLPYCEDCARARAKVVVDTYTAEAKRLLAEGHKDYRLKHVVFTSAVGLVTATGKPDLSGVPWRNHRDFWKGLNDTLDEYFRGWRDVARYEMRLAEKAKERKRPIRDVAGLVKGLKSTEAEALYRKLLVYRKAPKQHFWKYRWYEEHKEQLAKGVPWTRLGMGYFGGTDYGEGKRGNRLLHGHLGYFGPHLEHDVLCAIYKRRTGFKVIHIENLRKGAKPESLVKEITKYVTKITAMPAELVPALTLALHGNRRIRARGVFYGVKAVKKDKTVCCPECRSITEKMTELEWQDAIDRYEALQTNRNLKPLYGISQFTSGAAPPLDGFETGEQAQVIAQVPMFESLPYFSSLIDKLY